MERGEGVTFVLFRAVLKMHRLNIELLFFRVSIKQKTINIILKWTQKVVEQAVISVQKWIFFIIVIECCKCIRRLAWILNY